MTEIARESIDFHHSGPLIFTTVGLLKSLHTGCLRSNAKEPRGGLGGVNYISLSLNPVSLCIACEPRAKWPK
jgi:hypothetical protein